MPYAPISVFICEDDDLSRLSLIYLLTRDLRTKVTKAVESPAEMLWSLKESTSNEKADIILIDANYRSSPPLEQLIAEIRQIMPEIAVVCISEYAEEDIIQARLAISRGAKGFLDKDDIGLAVATALMQAYHTGFVFSKTVEPLIKEHFPSRYDRQHAIGKWHLHPGLQKRHIDVAYQSILYGMSARMVAQELSDLKGKNRLPETITRYRDEIYKILASDDEGFYDTTYLEEIADILTPTSAGGGEFYGAEWAFHMLIQPSRYEHPFFDLWRDHRSSRYG